MMRLRCNDTGKMHMFNPVQKAEDEFEDEEDEEERNNQRNQSLRLDRNC